ncbi:hypothetical protein EJI01_22825 [Variovorax sp. MHTC-1]|nr:hypothetical protein EJI01_22825 [Variovorax sp. MHTC-1]
MSEVNAASSAAGRLREHRRLPRSEAQGSQAVGSPFLCLLSFGEAKESESPAGARPGSRPQQNMQQPNQRPKSPHPNPLPEGEGAAAPRQVASASSAGL